MLYKQMHPFSKKEAFSERESIFPAETMESQMQPFDGSKMLLFVRFTKIAPMCELSYGHKAVTLGEIYFSEYLLNNCLKTMNYAQPF